jgi:hypothetical protein
MMPEKNQVNRSSIRSIACAAAGDGRRRSAKA